jgi:hypothetical protein
LDPDGRIAFLCPCSNALEAPASWADRVVTCPACGKGLRVPSATDPAAASALGERDAARRERTLDGAGLARVAEEASIRVIDVVPAAGLRASPVAGRPRRLSRRARRAITWSLVAATIAGLVGGALWWRHVYRRDFSAAGIMAKRGFGQRIQEIPRGEPALMDEVLAAEREWERSGRSHEAAVEMARVYRLVADRAGRTRADAYLLNNAAWFFATSPVAATRDIVAALRLSEAAVEITGAKDPNALDTLSEALFLNGRLKEALDAELAAQVLAPDAAYIAPQLAKIRAALEEPTIADC